MGKVSARGSKTTAIKINGIDHVVLRTRVIEDSLRFYCDVLGCREERQVESVGLIQLRAGRSLIDLVDAAGDPATGAPNMDHFALRVEAFDADAIRAHLQAHGVDMGKVATRYGAEGKGPSIYIKDPDDNTVEIKGPPDG